MRRGVALAFILAGCSGGNHDSASASTAPIVGGHDSQNRAVVHVAGLGNCTGTLLAPNLVLTAKHCVAQVKGGAYTCDENGKLVTDPDAGVVFVGAGEFGATADPSQLLAGHAPTSPYVPRVSQVLVSPGATLCDGDVALLVLDAPVDDPVLAPVRLDALPTIGEALTTLGYGLVSGKTAATTLQERDVSVTAVGPAPAVPSVTDAVPPGTFTTGEAVCSGDSGGPALASSGAVVGVTSSVSRADLMFPSGTAADCSGELVRSKFQATAAFADLIVAGYAAAGAPPWHEGDPDPRAGLAAFGEPCADDGECASNVCVPAEGGASCSQGCVDTPCPEGMACSEIANRLRCVAGPPPPRAAAKSDDGGCALRALPSRGHGSLAWALLGFALVGYRLGSSLSVHRGLSRTRGSALQRQNRNRVRTRR